MSGPLFKPFRALGYITEDIPFAVQRRGKETYAVVSVGRTWQIYNTAKLTLVMVGPQLPHTVTALACKGDVTFAAAGGVVHEAKRNRETGRYQGHSGQVLQLLVLGNELLSLGKDQQLLVWTIGQYSKPKLSMDLSGESRDFEPSCMTHPDTYINKVVVGGRDGSMQLWNFMSGQLVHSFKGWGSAIKCIAASPALDVVGVGLADGRAVLHNLRYDEQLMVLQNAAAAGTATQRFLAGSGAAAAAAASSPAVTCISFRTGAGLPLMAAGGSAGIIALWNLEGRCLHHVLRDAHDASLLSLHFFSGEPLLMSSAGDNSIKQWVLEGTEAVPRLLKFRSGHSAPPAVVRHYAEGVRLLSAGIDRGFRLFSTIQDQQSRELSQKNIASRAKKLKATQEELKLARVTQLAACETRERDWANVLTCHVGDPAAYTWRLQNYTLGEHILLPPPDQGGQGDSFYQVQQGLRERLQYRSPATAVAISCCGNFGIVGNDAGRIDRYNMQSGLHRGTYWRKQQQQQEPGSSSSSSTAPLLPAHDCSVVGLGADSTNSLLASVGSDGVVRTWNFRRQTLSAELPLGSVATHFALHAGSDLAAVACVDRVVRVIDIEACRVVRRFSGHSDRLTDMVISADSRWLLTAAMDCTLRVWDIPAAQCLQVMHLGSPVTSLSLSAAQDLLATAHTNKRGVFLWSNQLMFGDPAAVATYSDRPVPVHLPSIAAADNSRDEQQQQKAGAKQIGSNHVVRVAKQQQQQQDDEDDDDDDEEEDEDANHNEAGEDKQAAVPESLLRTAREVTLLIDGGDDASSSDFFMSDSDPDSDTDELSGPESDDADDAPAAAGFGSSSNDDDDEQQQQQQGTRRRKRHRTSRAASHAAAAAAAAVYKKTDAAGAPVPLGSHLATLSLLPRSQWENLLHLDTIKARSKPLQPAKKPEAAPFFLPTVPGLSGQPEFAAAAAGAAAAPAGAAADSDAQGAEAAKGGAAQGPLPAAGGSSRILSSRDGSTSTAAAPSQFVALLRNSAEAGDFSSFIAHVRTLSPAAIDLELRAMVVLESAEEGGQSVGPVSDEVQDIGLLLQCLEQELENARNFDMVQALLARVLVVHGDTLMRQPLLLVASDRLRRKLAPLWLRLDDMMHNIRCMVDFVSNAQA